MSARADDVVGLLLSRSFLGCSVGLALGVTYFVSALPLLMDAGSDMLDTFRSMALRVAGGVMVLAAFLTVVLRLPVPALLKLVAFGASVYAAAHIYRVLPLYYAGHFEVALGFDLRRTSLYMTWMHLSVAVLLWLWFIYEDRARRTRGALHEAQLAQQRAQHRTLESRLNMLRARVDPTFLFEALASTRKAYGESIPAAERQLDALIGFLRAALPQQVSSLAQEIRLADAYLEVAATVHGRRLALDADIDARFADAFFPPRVLMPFVEDAARRVRGPEGRLTIRGRLEGNRARVMLEDDGVAAPEPEAALLDLSNTLKAFFGPDASAAVHRGIAGQVVAIEYAHLPAPPGREAA